MNSLTSCQLELADATGTMTADPATETDDVVTVVLRRLRAHATLLARRAANPAVWTARARRNPAVSIVGIAFGWAPGS